MILLLRFLFIIAIAFMLEVAPVQAATACPTGQVETDIGCIPEDPSGFVTVLYGAGLGMIGGLSLLFIMWGGYLVMTSRGNYDQVQKGKSYIYYAISGLILAISGFTLYQVISKDILKLPGFE